MYKNEFGSILIFYMLLFWASHAFSSDVSDFQKKTVNLLTSHIQPLIDNRKIPSAHVVIYKEGELVDHVMGYQDVINKVPLRKDAIYAITSMTKPITVVALMMLYEQGKISLDDPVSDYIPNFKNIRIQVIGSDGEPKTEPLKTPILIRHLLTHTSGLTYHWDGVSSINQSYWDKGITPGVRNFLPKGGSPQPPITLKQMVDDLVSIPLLNQPGQEFNYSVSMDVIGYIIELVSGIPLDRFFSTYIFEPLGMIDTSFYVPKEKLYRLTTLYSHTEQGIMQVLDSHTNYDYSEMPTLLSGGSGLLSTVPDYLRFCFMLLNNGEFEGNRILKKETVELIAKDHIQDLYKWRATEDIGFGFNVYIVKSNNDPKTLGKKRSFGWGGGGSSIFHISPEEPAILIFMTPVIYPIIDLKIREELKNFIR